MWRISKTETGQKLTNIVKQLSRLFWSFLATKALHGRVIHVVLRSLQLIRMPGLLVRSTAVGYIDWVDEYFNCVLSNPTNSSFSCLLVGLRVNIRTWRRLVFMAEPVNLSARLRASPKNNPKQEREREGYLLCVRRGHVNKAKTKWNSSKSYNYSAVKNGKSVGTVATIIAFALTSSSSAVGIKHCFNLSRLSESAGDSNLSRYQAKQRIMNLPSSRVQSNFVRTNHRKRKMGAITDYCCV